MKLYPDSMAGFHRSPTALRMRRPSYSRSGPSLLDDQREERFEDRMEEMIAGIKGTPPAEGFEEVFYPGEIEARNDERHRREGLRLPEDTMADLARVAAETGLTERLPF